LNNNQISGIIPQSIGNLINLQQLWLNDNKISGSIPESIGNLENLIYLFLHNNQLSGSIPWRIVNLRRLTHLSIANNSFTGCIPDYLQVLQAKVDLRENYFFDCNFEPGDEWKMDNYNKPNPRAKSAMKIVTTD